jgi:WD40 repeat protein
MPVAAISESKSEFSCALPVERNRMHTPVALLLVASLFRQESLSLNTRIVRSVVFSPDGQQIASGNWDGAVYVWDVSRSTE